MLHIASEPWRLSAIAPDKGRYPESQERAMMIAETGFKWMTVAENLNSGEKPRISGVVSVAAPQAGLDSLSRLFSGLPRGLAAAFIIVVPGYDGALDKLREIIAQTSGLDVKIVGQKDKL